MAFLWENPALCPLWENPQLALNERSRFKGVDLGHLEDEDTRRIAFAWITRTGAGRHFGTVPIGWYQQHQMAALETLTKAATEKGMPPNPRDGLWLFRLRQGEFQVFDYENGRWVKLDLSPRQVFEKADRR